ncbi:MAG: type II toxin-antitoxin system RelE/ParE family toxin [Thermoleophilia bacterium]
MSAVNANVNYRLCRLGNGEWPVLAVMDDRGGCQVAQFLESVDDAESQKMWARFGFTVDHGPPTNAEHFKPIHKKRGAFEFKTKHLRIFCFRDGKRIVCTHGLTKGMVKSYATEEQKVLAEKDRYLASSSTEIIDYEGT